MAKQNKENRIRINKSQRIEHGKTGIEDEWMNILIIKGWIDECKGR